MALQCVSSGAKTDTGQAVYDDNNRAENSHLPVRRRERKMQRFKSQRQAQKFVSTHGPIYNAFNVQRPLISRNTMRKFRASAMEEWMVASAVEE